MLGSDGFTATVLLAERGAALTLLAAWVLLAFGHACVRRCEACVFLSPHAEELLAARFEAEQNPGLSLGDRGIEFAEVLCGPSQAAEALVRELHEELRISVLCGDTPVVPRLPVSETLPASKPVTASDLEQLRSELKREFNQSSDVSEARLTEVLRVSEAMLRCLEKRDSLRAERPVTAAKLAEKIHAVSDSRQEKPIEKPARRSKAAAVRRSTSASAAMAANSRAATADPEHADGIPGAEEERPVRSRDWVAASPPPPQRFGSPAGAATTTTGSAAAWPGADRAPSFEDLSPWEKAANITVGDSEQHDMAAAIRQAQLDAALFGVSQPSAASGRTVANQRSPQRASATQRNVSFRGVVEAPEARTSLYSIAGGF
eukprot:gnl/TRDRNA2_/TRDRNA2_148569_c1_seq1.p1 gnl/TRDRNA2_/TRDRNA2_148569_c1~~gnl/TRDRNA2_/TRDRNA2_148569_c1_seq1.p1  ORF type:complete len:375 (-),score=69.77 gnl/TRDRNA2_/TRDRNA2_148569_c1_seq1:111-1235(-)